MRPRKSRGQVFGTGNSIEDAAVHCPFRLASHVRREGERTSAVSPTTAASRICSSWLHRSVFSRRMAFPAAGTAAGRGQAAIHTSRSSPLRTSSTSRYWREFSESVTCASTGDAASPTRAPDPRSAASNARRAAPSSAEPSEETFRHVMETGSPLPTRAAVFRASSRAAPFRSSAARAPCGGKSSSAERTAYHLTAAMIAHRDSPTRLLRESRRAGTLAPQRRTPGT